MRPPPLITAPRPLVIDNGPVWKRWLASPEDPPLLIAAVVSIWLFATGHVVAATLPALVTLSDLAATAAGPWRSAYRVELVAHDHLRFRTVGGRVGVIALRSIRLIHGVRLPASGLVAARLVDARGDEVVLRLRDLRPRLGVHEAV